MKSFQVEMRLYNSRGFVPVRSGSLTVQAIKLSVAAYRAIRTAENEAKGKRIKSLQLKISQV